ncbi:MAG TPA: XdhC/CoxI family protein [Candidatus Limnocylindria bacterium]
MRQVAAELLAWRAAEGRVAIATVVGITGSAPRPLGATLLVAPNERLAGSVSNGCVEADVYEEALSVLQSGRARVVRYGISDDRAFTVGLSCGGTIEVLIEPVGPLHERAALAVRNGTGVVLARIVSPEDHAGTVGVWTADPRGDGWSADLAPLGRDALGALREGQSRSAPLRLADGREASVFLHAVPAPATLAIVGATDIAIALVHFAKPLGYRSVVLDPRKALASRERFPQADELVHEWPDIAFGHLALDDSSAIVVLSHDEKFDQPALLAALRSRAGYIGAIGSTRTNEKRFAWLRSRGSSDDDLARIHAPIGLDIGARTAEETALAIVAEMLAARRGRAGGSLSARNLVTTG